MDFVPEKIFEGQDYDKEFKPGPYNQVYWSETPDPEMDLTHVRDFMVNQLTQHFAKIGKFDKLLDLGCGPAFHASLAAQAKEMYFADYTKVSLDALGEWFTGNESQMGVNFDYLIKIFAEKMGTDWKTLKGSIKARNRGILTCDVLKPGCELKSYLGGGKVPKSFDVITTLYCVEAAAKTLADFKAAVKRAVDLLNPGGHLVYVGNLNTSFYPTGPEDFFWVLKLSKEDVVSSLEEVGMKVLEFDTVPIIPEMDEMVFGLLAKRV